MAKILRLSLGKIFHYLIKSTIIHFRGPFTDDKNELPLSVLLTFNIQKHCVTHCHNKNNKNVKVTDSSITVISRSRLLRFDPLSLDFSVFIVLPNLFVWWDILYMMSPFKVAIDNQGARTRNIQCTQNSYISDPFV